MESTETRDFRLQQLGRNLLGLDYNNSVPFEKVFRRFNAQRFPAPPVIGQLPNHVVGFKQRLFPPYVYPEYSADPSSLEERRKWGMRRDGDEALTPMNADKKAAVELANQLSKASQRGDYREVLRLLHNRVTVDICVIGLVRLTEISRSQNTLKQQIQNETLFDNLLAKIAKLWDERNSGFNSEAVISVFTCLVHWQRITPVLAGEFLIYLVPFLDQMNVRGQVMKILDLLRNELVNHPGVFAMNAGIGNFVEKVVEIVAKKSGEPDVLASLALTLAIAQMKIDYFTDKLVIHTSRNAENFSSLEHMYILYYLLGVGHNEDAELVGSVSRVLARVSFSLNTTNEDAAIACYVMPQFAPEFDKSIILPYLEKLSFSHAWKSLSPFYLSRALYGLGRSSVAFVDSSVLCPLELHIQDLAKRHKRICDGDAVARFLAVFTMRMESRSFIVDSLSVRFFKEASQTGPAMADCLLACVAAGNAVLSPNEIDMIMSMGVPKLIHPRAAMNLIVKASGFAAVEKLRLLVDKFLSFPDVKLKELVYVLQSLVQRSFYHSGVCARLVSALIAELAEFPSAQYMSPLQLQAIQALNEVDRSGHLEDSVVDTLASYLSTVNNVTLLNHNLYVDLLAFVALRFPKLSGFKAIAAKLSPSKLPYLSPDYRWRLFLALAILAVDDAGCADCLKYVTPSLAPYPYARLDIKRFASLLEEAKARVTLIFEDTMVVKPELVVNDKRALVVQDRPYLSIMNTDERKQSVTQRLQVRYLDFCHHLDCVVAVKLDVSVFAQRTATKLLNADL